jgi:leucyl/phenylalanyl-tRNA--protein transferase
MLFKFNYIEILNYYSRGYFHTHLLDAVDKQFFFYLPKTRPLIPASGMYVSRTLRRKINQQLFQIKIDTDFEEIVKSCARDDEPWITPELIQVYKYLFKLGYAHSVGCYQDDKLVGGVFGLAIGAGFFAKSMFSRVIHASKIAFYYLTLELQKQNFEFMDCQIMSDHLLSLGAVSIDDKTFEVTLNRSIKTTTDWGKDIFQIKELTKFKIETKRLLITAMTQDDSESVINLGNNLEVHQFSIAKPVSNKWEFDEYLKLAQNANSNGIPDCLAIRIKENNLFIGTIEMYYPQKDQPTIELGIEIDPLYWGKRYAKEAFSKAIDFIFEAYPVFRIQARALPENTRSNHLLKSVGFNFEGTLKQACWYNQIYDLNYYSITRDSYHSPSPP